MKKLYCIFFLSFLIISVITRLHAQEVIWAAANPYQGSSRLVTAVSGNGAQVDHPIPFNNDDLWGTNRPSIYLASDGNVYGFTQNFEGSLLYKITDNGIFPVRQFEYGSFGPMAEGDPGNFYVFSSGADGNYVVIERSDSEGGNYKQFAIRKPGFRPQKLLNSNGVIYGVSTSGGANSGSGYIFRFTPTAEMNRFEVIYNFSTVNGRKPVGGLIEGSDGYLYGVTSTGGANEGGVIYKIKKDGSGFTKIFDFNYNTGRYPQKGIVADASGWLWGMTSNGTPGFKTGSMFKVRMDGTNFMIIGNVVSTNESMGEMLYHNGFVYSFARLPGKPPQILKFAPNGTNTVFHTYAQTDLFAGYSLLGDSNPKAATIYATTPANGSTVSHINTRFAFTPVTNANLYTFELSLTGDFTNPVGRGQNTKPEYIATDLKPNTKYYVRVKSNVWPTFGPTTSFTTAPLVVSHNRITNPANGAINVPAPSAKVTAGTVTGAKRYTIELSTSPDFATKIVRTSKVDGQRTMVFDSLQYATKYYGRCKSDITAFGQVTSFTTTAEIFATLVYPNDMRGIGPTVVNLVIDPTRNDAKRHTIQLSTSSQFTTTPIEVKSVEDYQTNFIVKDLQYDTRYFVRMKSDLNYNWSRTYSFTTRNSVPQKRLWGVTTSGGVHDAGTVFSVSLDDNTFRKEFDYDPITWEEEEEYYDYGETLQGSLIHGADEKLYFHSSTKNSSAYGGSLFEIDYVTDIRHVEEIALHYGNMTLASNNTIYTSVNSHLGPGVIDSYELHSRIWERMHVFTRSNGVDPGSELVELHDGYLYGRATEGGVNNAGTLYRMKYDGSGFQVTHTFETAVNGQKPTGDLALGDDGFFYGTTMSGGLYGMGTVYKVKPDGTQYTKIFDFNGGNGARPMGGVILRGDVMWGTTSAGGVNNLGTIFKLYTDGNGFVNLFNFSGGNGSTPVGRLTYDSYTLYGMTSMGGNGNKGVIFRISTTGVAFSVMHHFDGVSGGYPDGHLIVKEDMDYVMPTNPVEEEEESMVQIAPNPSTADFAISLAASAEEPVFISITDMNGTVVHESTVRLSESKRVGESLQKGIYILKARRGDHVTMHRLVKK